MDNLKILVSDDVSESGLEPLRAAGFVVEKRTGLKPEELTDLVRDCDGLVVRSETKVTPELMDAALRLRAIGRAGVGVDNIDVAAATARGIIVMNAPDGNTMTTAEHAVALLLALARRVPQGNASLRAGKWERKKFVGVELRGKTLGVVGLGRIGRVVASRALGFEMKVVAFDPFVAPEQMANTEIEFATLDEVCARADFLTVHTPLTAETRGIVGAREIALMKPEARVINCARGGLVDERALYDALKDGRIAGAALDVFEQEPPPADYPLLQLEQVIATPHLGASTLEAQEGVAVTVAEQMRDYFQTGALRGAVNAPSLGAQELNVLQPYLTLAERLGRFQAQLVDEAVREVRLEYAGEIAEMDAAPVTRAFLAGLLRGMSARVNVVNAFIIAEERGITVTTSYRHAGAGEMAPAIRTRVMTSAGAQTVSGAMFGRAGEGRITEINDFHVEAVPAGHVIVTRSRDVPGVIGRVGTILGTRGVNISRFHLGRRELGGEAIAVIETDARVDDATVDEILSTGQVFSARRIHLDS
ncbi:MAG: phosphoglycerate dehydrogenase [Acidobacteria bacterium]|nr:phosphoglycerate dehydrogenase [Acidobacteriota bacterium]MCA1641686.1 phosphoglycerate dehydrogenase [Acidobacteriota bacterium]